MTIAVRLTQIRPEIITVRFLRKFNGFLDEKKKKTIITFPVTGGRRARFLRRVRCTVDNAMISRKTATTTEQHRGPFHDITLCDTTTTTIVTIVR